MSTSVDQSFVRQYESEVKHVFQREGGLLRPTVRMKTGVQGKSTTVQKIGKGTATTKARHGEVTPMNQDHTPVQVFLEDFYAGDYSDLLDEAKVNIDERMVIARGGAWALGRKVDDQILTELDATTQPVITWSTGSSAAIRNAMIEMVEALHANDVMNDGMIFGVLSPRAWSQAMTIEEFASSDYIGNDGLPFNNGFAVGGRFKSWMNVNWTMHPDVPGAGTATSKQFVFHQTAIAYATGRHARNNAENDIISADVQWIGPRVAHWINHWMSGGAKLIDDTGVIEGNLDDTTGIVTT